MNFFRGFRQSTQAGLVAVCASAGRVRYARALAGGAGRPVVLSCGSLPWSGDAKSLARAYGETGAGRSARCTTLLNAGEYQMAAVEAPPVPAEEMQAAMRWRMKDIIDYPVEQCVYDLLEIPPPPGGVARSRLIFVVSARSEFIRACVQRFADARIPLAVIDVPETAQRNVTSLYEREGRGVGLLYFSDGGGLLTVTAGSELYLSRRFDFTAQQIHAESGDIPENEDTYGRILLELQRTLDNFERQHSKIPLSRIMVGPQPAHSPLADYLHDNLGVVVDDVHLEDVLDFRCPVPDAKTQWELFHVLGSAIRVEPAAP